jgi:hypothetical protein
VQRRRQHTHTALAHLRGLECGALLRQHALIKLDLLCELALQVAGRLGAVELLLLLLVAGVRVRVAAAAAAVAAAAAAAASCSTAAACDTRCIALYLCAPPTRFFTIVCGVWCALLLQPAVVRKARGRRCGDARGERARLPGVLGRGHRS